MENIVVRKINALNNYSVTKNYGHFTQIYHIEAESEEDAWVRAERDGKL